MVHVCGYLKEICPEGMGGIVHCLLAPKCFAIYLHKVYAVSHLKSDVGHSCFINEHKIIPDKKCCLELADFMELSVSFKYQVK